MMIVFSLKQFQWNKEKNILLIHSDEPMLNENWHEIVINKGYFDIQSHVTGISYSFVYEDTVSTQDGKGWEKIICHAPGMNSRIPKVHILPPANPTK